ncbi:unnamed protein product [Callosobruchus maculatus]|nr:unnamed protein product [Callosobruchus maculatus]
MCNLSK